MTDKLSELKKTSGLDMMGPVTKDNHQAPTYRWKLKVRVVIESELWS